MSCGMCESHVNDAVRNACHVKKVESSHKKNLTVVYTEDETAVPEIVTAIKALGYNVLGVTTEPYEKRGFFDFLKGKKKN